MSVDDGRKRKHAYRFELTDKDFCRCVANAVTRVNTTLRDIAFNYLGTMRTPSSGAYTNSVLIPGKPRGRVVNRVHSKTRNAVVTLESVQMLRKLLVDF